jgi:hypothetical protein
LPLLLLPLQVCQIHRGPACLPTSRYEPVLHARASTFALLGALLAMIVVTHASTAAQCSELRAKIAETIASADDATAETRHGAELQQLRAQLAEAEALAMALKVGSPRRLRVQGEYIDNPSAPVVAAPSPVTGAGAVPVVAPTLSGRKHSPATKRAKQRPQSGSPKRQPRAATESAGGMFERERERVAARNEWLAKQRQVGLDRTLAQATFTPRISRRRYKADPPARRTQVQIDDGSAGTADPEANAPSQSLAAQAAATKRFQAETGYWPRDDELLKYMLKPVSEPEPEPEPEPPTHEPTTDEPASASVPVEPLPPGSVVPPPRISMEQYATIKSRNVAKGLAIQANHRSQPSYGRLSPALLPTSVDDARAVSPTALAGEAATAASSGRISAPCLETPLATPVRMRPRTAGPVPDTWPEPKGYSEQARGDTTDDCPFTPRIVVHQLKGDRLARRLAHKPASRSRLDFLANPNGLPKAPPGVTGIVSPTLPKGSVSPKQPAAASPRRRKQPPRPAFLVEAEHNEKYWEEVVSHQMQKGPA